MPPIQDTQKSSCWESIFYIAYHDYWIKKKTFNLFSFPLPLSFPQVLFMTSKVPINIFRHLYYYYENVLIFFSITSCPLTNKNITSHTLPTTRYLPYKGPLIIRDKFTLKMANILFAYMFRNVHSAMCSNPKRWANVLYVICKSLWIRSLLTVKMLARKDMFLNCGDVGLQLGYLFLIIAYQSSNRVVTVFTLHSSFSFISIN